MSRRNRHTQQSSIRRRLRAKQLKKNAPGSPWDDLVSNPIAEHSSKKRVPWQYQVGPGVLDESGTDLGMAGFAISHRRVFSNPGSLRRSQTGTRREDLNDASERAEPPRRSVHPCFAAGLAGLDGLAGLLARSPCDCVWCKSKSARRGCGC
jgi:hypothetical protein